MRTASPTCRVGCCGFAGKQTDYYRTFPCVEIDSSFYQLPKLETAARWRTAAPADFQFCFKAWQVITHPPTSPTYKRTRLDDHDRQHCGYFGFDATIRWAWDETFAVAQALKAAVVLFQCPASFRPNRENLANFRRFFERAKRGKLHFAWEPRGNWEPDLIAALCRELDLIHVVDPFKGLPAAPSKIAYYRLHGLTGARHRYTDAELDQLRQFCRQCPTTYCFFNTLAMDIDAQRFMARQSRSR